MISAVHRVDIPATEDLGPAECWRLLGTKDLGRLALTAIDGVDIFPVNYTVNDGLLYFRTAPGKKMIDLTGDPIVAFEADGTANRHRWSVVVRGRAERVNFDIEIETSGVNELKSLSPTTKWNYVRITPSAITGRRFRAQR
ncbi:MAG: pyridoxamine 5'-phosphate oxidase family protein [Actinomycetota bacterium]